MVAGKWLCPLTALLRHHGYKPDGFFCLTVGGSWRRLEKHLSLCRRSSTINSPPLGFALGHQILGLSWGASTFKLKFGHPGVEPALWSPQRQVELPVKTTGFAIVRILFPKILFR